MDVEVEETPVPAPSKPLIESTMDSATSDNSEGQAVTTPAYGSSEANGDEEQLQNISSISEEANVQGEVNSRHNHLQPSDTETPESSNSNGMHLINSSLNGENDEAQQSTSKTDEEADMDSMSEISDFSDFSQESWHPVQGHFAWVQEQMRQGQNARSILEDLVPPGTVIPEGIDPIMMWRLIINIMSEPPKRRKLESINTLEDVISLLNSCNKIIVLTGAGVSVSCGIPDFRSRDGVYARLAVDFPNLPDPQAMFDIDFFRKDPRPFFKFAKEIYPGQFKPSLCHHFIRLIESQGKLLRNYTQNIDTLEQEAGIERVVQCHGSFATATCTNCKLKVKSDVVREDIFKQVIPRCPQCPEGTENAIMKPDIVFFGESLPEDFHKQMAQDKDECDLLIVIGSSLKVRPVALIPNSVPPHVPQILINRERLHYLNFDVELLGNCDDIVGELCHKLGSGWNQLAPPEVLPLTEIVMSSLPTPPISPRSENPAISSSSSSSVPLKNDKEESKEVKSESESKSDSVETASTSFENKHEDGDVDDKVGSVEIENDSCTESGNGDNIEPVSSEAVPCNEVGCVESVSSSDIPSSSLSQATSSSSSSIDERKKAEQITATAANAFVTGEVTTTTMTSTTASLSVDRSAGGGDHLGLQEEGEGVSKNNTASDVVSSTTSEHKANHHNHHHNHHHHHRNHNQYHSHHHNHHHNHKHQNGHHHHHQSSCRSSSSNIPSTSGNNHQKGENESCSDMEPVEKRPRLESKDDANSKATSEELTSSTTETSATTSAADYEQPIGHMEDEELEEMRKMWQGRKNRTSLAQRLADNQYLFLPPNRYVFKGAEVFSDSEEEADSDDDDDNNNNDNNSDDGKEASNGDGGGDENSSNDVSVEEEQQQQPQQQQVVEEQVVEIEDTVVSNSTGEEITSEMDIALSSTSTKSSIPITTMANDVVGVKSIEKDTVGDVSSTNENEQH